MGRPSPLRDATVLVANLHPRFAGVAATVLALVPRQRETRGVAVLDLGKLGLADTVRPLDLLRFGWRPPAGCRQRVWHGRRSLDLAVGLLLKYALRQPWKFVFTSPSPRRHGFFWRWMINRTDAVIAVSENAASFLDWHTVIIPHGVDTDAFHPPADKRAAWAETGLPGKYGVGIFGRIRPGKGTDLFVDAMCELLPRHPDFTAVLTGLCKPAHQRFQAALKERIRRAGLEKRVVFLGNLGHADVKRWQRRVSLCVAPSRSEGFGLAPLEAMASGAAVVASRSGYFPQMIQPGITGALCETGNGRALTEAIEKLLSDPATLLQMGQAARRRAVERHAIAREVAAIDAVYDALLAGDALPRKQPPVTET